MSQPLCKRISGSGCVDNVLITTPEASNVFKCSSFDGGGDGVSESFQKVSNGIGVDGVRGIFFFLGHTQRGVYSVKGRVSAF